MKKVFIGMTILLLFFACKSPFMKEFEDLSAQKRPLPEAPIDDSFYFKPLPIDGELDIQRDLPFPIHLSASQGEFSDKIELSWQKVSLKDHKISYQVYRKESANEWELLAKVLTNASYTDSNVMEGLSYTYSVRALFTDAKGITLASRLSYLSEGMVFSHLTEITASLRDFDDRIVLSWKPSAGANEYWVYRSLDKNEFDATPIAILPASKLQYIDYSDAVYDTPFDITYGKEYFYKVIPIRVVEQQKIQPTQSEQILIVIGAILAPGAPPAQKLLSVSKAEFGGGIQLIWEPNPGVEMAIYRSEKPTGQFQKVASKITSDSYLDNSFIDLNDPESLNRVYYYRIAGASSGEEGPLSKFDPQIHSGKLFSIPPADIDLHKLIYPETIVVVTSSELQKLGDQIYYRYTTDTAEPKHWTEYEGGPQPTSQAKTLLNIPNYDSQSQYWIQARLVNSELVKDPIFDDSDTTLYGKSHIYQTEVQKGGPLAPELALSQGDPSIPGKIRITATWPNYPEYGNYVDVKIIRHYTFGKEASSKGAIEVKQKELVFDTANLFQTVDNAATFTVVDNLIPDLNPTQDFIKPMNAEIPAGSGWTYWTWDREAWKYLNRKLPFDMKKAVGCDYEVFLSWKDKSDGWDLPYVAKGYGFPGLTNEEFAWLSLWMREVAMNRLWHLQYPSFHRMDVGKITASLTAGQIKHGEYAGEVGFTAKADGLGGSGNCWLRNYSDWGPEWNINIDTNAESSFVIILKYKDIATFDMPISIKTPLYEGKIHCNFKLENGLYQDRLRAGSSLKVRQKVAGNWLPEGTYNQLEAPNSLVHSYFPKVGYEQRMDPSSKKRHCYELTTINFKYPIEQWDVGTKNKEIDDWTQYYGFQF